MVLSFQPPHFSHVCDIFWALQPQRLVRIHTHINTLTAMPHFAVHFIFVIKPKNLLPRSSCGRSLATATPIVKTLHKPSALGLALTFALGACSFSSAVVASLWNSTNLFMTSSLGCHDVRANLLILAAAVHPHLFRSCLPFASFQFAVIYVYLASS